jgi:hypothetical protein
MIYFQLESPLNFSMAGVAPVCLSADDGVKPGAELLMAGWGQTNYCITLLLLGAIRRSLCHMSVPVPVLITFYVIKIC